VQVVLGLPPAVPTSATNLVIPAQRIGHLRDTELVKGSSSVAVVKTNSGPHPCTSPARRRQLPTTSSRPCFKGLRQGPKAGGGDRTPARAGKVPSRQGVLEQAGGRPAT